MGEIFEGPPDPSSTWLVENEANSGVSGTLDALTASRAYARPGCGRHSPAQHAHHMLFSLRLVNAIAIGETPNSDWESSWQVEPGGDAAWAELRQALRAEYHQALENLDGVPLTDAEGLKGVVGTVAHMAYHLGAIRQAATS
jgi:hypothetical protein